MPPRCGTFSDSIQHMLRIRGSVTRNDRSLSGLPVHGDNRFIVRGPFSDRDVAQALIRHWLIIQIGATTPPSLEEWRISTKEFSRRCSLGACLSQSRQTELFSSVIILRV